MTVITRFAPSPTGYLHIGSARTALFNWLFARHHKGKFYLRIEDTDRVRSTPEAIDAIFSGLSWLELQWDGEPIFQFDRAKRHQEVAHTLLEQGKAYYCYASPEELDEMRQKAMLEGRPARYDGRWRNRDPKEAPAGVKPVIRLKAPQEGFTVVQDLAQGEVKVANTQLDDMVLLRSDGTPTYMLAVVVDDHDMGVTHVIRGDDHLTNTFRQYQIYEAMDWAIPLFTHIPLIHGADGAKLSKRHGALGVYAYKDMGLLPEAMRNYLLRLGWSHGDDEIISTEQAIEWFGVENIGKSPARFDMAKLTNLNAHYLKETDNQRLLALIKEGLEKQKGSSLTSEDERRLLEGMEGLKVRSKTLTELQESAFFYIAPLPLKVTDEGKKILTPEAKERLIDLCNALEGSGILWEAPLLEAFVKSYGEQKTLKLKDIAQPLRVALTGSTISPGLFEVMEVLGQYETLKRLKINIG